MEGIGQLQQRPPRRMLMGEAHAQAERTVAFIETLPGVASATVAGSVRRWRETVGDLDVLIETERPRTVLSALAASDLVEPESASGRGTGERAHLRLADGPSLDVMTMPGAAAGSYLVHLTGSAEHNVALRHRAREMGWSLSERGLVPLDDVEKTPTTFPTESDLYAFLGLTEDPARAARGSR